MDSIWVDRDDPTLEYDAVIDDSHEYITIYDSSSNEAGIFSQQEFLSHYRPKTRRAIANVLTDGIGRERS